MRRSSFAFALLLTIPLAACGGGGGDDDGPAVCGDGNLSDGEECDDGNTDPGDGCDQDCVSEVPPTAYRADAVFIRDPHFWITEGFELDVTDTVNDDLADAISMDTDDPPDGLLNLSLLFVFRPVAPDSEESRADAVLGADCTAPVAGTSCSNGDNTSVVETIATNGDGTCLEPIADSTSGYDPPVGTPSGRCFVTEPEDITLTASGIALSLIDAQVAATYGGGAPDTLTSGLMMGFMTQAAADATILPKDTPLVGGQPLSNILLDEDKDPGPNGEDGWWFYFNFTAAVATYTE